MLGDRQQQEKDAAVMMHSVSTAMEYVKTS